MQATAIIMDGDDDDSDPSRPADKSPAWTAAGGQDVDRGNATDRTRDPDEDADADPRGGDRQGGRGTAQAVLGIGTA